MTTAKHPGAFCKRPDGMLDDLILVNCVGFLIRDVEVHTVYQANAQHNLCHGHAL